MGIEIYFFDDFFIYFPLGMNRLPKEKEIFLFKSSYIQ